jgi:hypothetical protein
MQALRKRPLAIREILDWATRHKETAGKWPTRDSGEIPGSHGETWAAVDAALHRGTRNLKDGGGSLAKLLADKCGARNVKNLPSLTEKQILAWADAHHDRTGEWPTRQSGTIPDSGGYTWQSIENALRLGFREVRGGSSLAKLLAQHRGVRNRKGPPKLTETKILALADAHHERTGEWPGSDSGPIADAPGETWLAADMALRLSRRGLPGGSSLALLLAEKRGVRNLWSRPDLSYEQVLQWADAHRERTGEWPHAGSGPIPEAPGETWKAVNHALKRGRRTLSGGYSLAEVLAVERGARKRNFLPPLRRKDIIKWAAAYHRRTGKWPTATSDPIPESPGDTWLIVDNALKHARRELHGVSSLARLLAQFGKKRNIHGLADLSYKRIVAWADAHHARTGR